MIFQESPYFETQWQLSLERKKKKCLDFFFSFQNSFIEMQVSYGTVYLITVYNPVWGIFTNVRKHLTILELFYHLIETHHTH